MQGQGQWRQSLSNAEPLVFGYIYLLDQNENLRIINLVQEYRLIQNRGVPMDQDLIAQYSRQVLRDPDTNNITYRKP